MKRVISLLLVCCFIAVALVSCKKPDETPTGPSSGPDGSQPLGSDEFGQQQFVSAVPVDELNFEGDTLYILCRDVEGFVKEFGKADAETLGELAEKLAERNSTVETDLNINIDVITKGYSTSGNGYQNYLNVFNGEIDSAVNGGTRTYDIVAHFGGSGAASQIRDCNAELNNKEVFPYFDFTLPCWNQSIINDTTLNGKLYFVVGDLNISVFDQILLLWCNKDLYETMKTDDDPEDIQQHAIDGDFIYADLYEWAGRYDDSSDDTDCCDTYGFLPVQHTNDTIPYAWNFDLVVKENDGSYRYNILGNYNAETYLTEWRALLNQDGIGKDRSATANPCGKERTGHFVNGNYVFMSSQLYQDHEKNRMIREMEDKYCIIPMPKYDEDQENYGTTCVDAHNTIGVLDYSAHSTPTKGEAISAYLQYSTEKSYTNIRAYYIENIIKGKTFGVDDSDGTVSKSIKIFEIIADSVVIDVPMLFSPLLHRIVWLWREIVDETTTLENAYKSNSFGGMGYSTQKNYDDAMAAFNKWVLE